MHLLDMFIMPHCGKGGSLDIVQILLSSYAVMAFLVLSGFVITTSIIRNMARNEGRFNARKFFADRVVRLYPALLFSTVLLLGIYGLFQLLHLHGAETFRLEGDLYLARERVSLEWDRLISSLFFLQEVVNRVPAPSLNSPLWSLSYEFWIYVLAMLSVHWLANKRFLGGVLTFALLGFLIFRASPRFFPLTLTWSGGAFWAFLYHRRDRLRKEIDLWTLPLGAGLLLILSLWVRRSGMAVMIHTHLDYRAFLVQSLICWVLMLAALRLSLASHRIPSILLKMHVTARYSYTLYVTAFPLSLLGFGLSHPTLHGQHWVCSAGVGLLIGVPIMFTAGTLSKVVENKPLVWRLLRRFFPRLVAWVSTPPATARPVQEDAGHADTKANR